MKIKELRWPIRTRRDALKEMLKMKIALDELLKTKGKKNCSG
jgi:hypothetical protein